MKWTDYIRDEDIEELKRKQELFKKFIKGKVTPEMQNRIDECGTEIYLNKKK